MSLRARFYLALASSFIAIGAHLVADYLYLYWTLPYIDVPIHILGGIMSGLFAGVALRFCGLTESWKNMLAGALVIGISWEVLEIGMGAVEFFDQRYYIDTIKDLIDDLIGGSIAYLIWRKL